MQCSSVNSNSEQIVTCDNSGIKCCEHCVLVRMKNVQSKLDSLKTDGLFTMANSNSFLSPYEVLPIAQENKYLGNFSDFIVKSYVVCTHRGDSNEYTQHTIIV